MQDCWIVTCYHLHFTGEKTVSQRWTFSRRVTLVGEDWAYQVRHVDPCRHVAEPMAISSSLGTAWALNKCLKNARVGRHMSVILLTVTSTSIPAFSFPSIGLIPSVYSIQVCWEDRRIMSSSVQSGRRVSCWGSRNIPIIQSCPCPGDHDWQKAEPWRWSGVEPLQRRQAWNSPNPFV